MNLTLRQMVNNHPVFKWVNSSKVGKQFQNSAFARNIEAVNYTLGKNISDCIVEGEGVLAGVVAGIQEILDSGKPWSNYERVTKYLIESSRPDLNGGLNPQNYALALLEEKMGRPVQTILDKYGVPQRQVA
jgi:hypothetical protein